MTKNEFIIQAVLSLNAGDSGYIEPVENRIKIANKQADMLEDQGLFEAESNII